MTNKTEILEKARLAFDNGDFEGALHELEVLGADLLWAELTKKPAKSGKTRWLFNSEFSLYFWENLSNKPLLTGLASSYSSNDFLTKYFQCGFNINPTLLESISADNGDQIIDAIRTNQLFVKIEWDDFLDSIPLPPSHEIHRRIWQKIRNNERTLWSWVQNSLVGIQNVPEEVILSCLCISYEEQRFQKNDKITNLLLSTSYSSLIEMLLAKPIALDFSDLTSDGLQQTFITIFDKLNSEKDLPEFVAVDNLVKSHISWQHYRDWIIEKYSFTKDFSPFEIGGELFLRDSPENTYSFRVDGARYQLNQLQYMIAGDEFLDKLISQGLISIPTGKNDHDAELNRIFAVQKWSTLLLLEDLGIEKLRNSNNTLDVLDWSGGLMAYAFNRMQRYEVELKALSRFNKDWVKTYRTYLSIHWHRSSFCFPFEVWNETNFDDFLISAHNGFKSDASAFIFSHISFQPTSKKEFDRFKNTYDAIRTPFVRSGNMIFAPQFVFATNTWFYYSAQVAMEYQKHQKPDRSETEKFEQNIFEGFKRNHKWKTQMMTSISNEIEGDVDISVTDGIDVLWIQAKRTYFRLNPRDMRNEEYNSDNKAVSQLLKAEQSVKENHTSLDLAAPTMKWIVSNSFEKIGNNFSGCFKINYFELLRALSNLSITSLRELEKYLVNNQELQAISNSIQDEDFIEIESEVFGDIPDSLKLFDSTAYVLHLGSPQSDFSEQYKMFTTAKQLFEMRRNIEAIEAWNRYAEKYPNDHDAWVSLGHTYADIQDYESAINCFKKSLELIPNCPSLMRNLAHTYYAAGLISQGFTLSLELLELYPLLIRLRAEVKSQWHLILTKALLSPKEIIALEENVRKHGLV